MRADGESDGKPQAPSTGLRHLSFGGRCRKAMLLCRQTAGSCVFLCHVPFPGRLAVTVATHCICPQRRPVLSRRTLSAISSDHCSRIRVTTLLVHTMDFSTPSLVGGGSYPFFGSGGCRGGFCLEREAILIKLWGKGERCMRLFIIKMNNNNNNKKIFK